MPVMHGWLRRVKIRKLDDRLRPIGLRTDQLWSVEPCSTLLMNHKITLQSVKRKPLQQ